VAGSDVLSCRSGHQNTSDAGLFPVFCTTCGARLKEPHPFLWGAVVGFGFSIFVSLVELEALGYTANAPLGYVWLLAAIPLVFALNAGFGVVYLKGRFGNLRGLGSVVLGTVPVVFVFFILWIVLLVFLSLLLSCGGGGEC
jgi:hypothetical protein